MKETHSRSLAKMISWRAVATITTFCLVFIATGNITMALSVGVAEVLLKMSFYYGHERAWTKVSWGTAQQDNRNVTWQESKVSKKDREDLAGFM